MSTIIIVVFDNLRWGLYVSSVVVFPMGLQVNDGNDRVDFPCCRQLEFVSQFTDGTSYWERTHSLFSQFIGGNRYTISRVETLSQSDVDFIARIKGDGFMTFVVIKRHLSPRKC